MNITFLSPYGLLPLLLVIHGVIGGIDTLVNHELIARLPHRIAAKREVGIHVLREAVYAALFGAIAWFDWHGAWAILIAMLLFAALAVDAVDEFVENCTRILPQNERMLHFALILNLGFITVAMLPILIDWYLQPGRLVPADHGLPSWILSTLALAAALWSLRDALAWFRLRNQTRGTSAVAHLMKSGQIGN